MELRHIRAAICTEPVFHSDGDAGQRAITTDTENYVYKDQANTKTITLARQYYYDGSITYLDNKFGNVEVHNDLYVSEYVRKLGFSNISHRFQSDRIDTTILGNLIFSVQDDLTQAYRKFIVSTSIASSDRIVTIENPTGQTAKLTFNTDGNTAKGEAIVEGAGTEGIMKFNTRTGGNSNTHLILLPSGYFGVGISPVKKFHLYEATNLTLRLQSGSTDDYVSVEFYDTAVRALINYIGSTDIAGRQGDLEIINLENDITFRLYTTGEYEAARIKANGNFGIGTNNPGQKLEVDSGNSDEATIRISNTEGYLELGANGGGGVLRTDTSLVALFSANGNITCSTPVIGSTKTASFDNSNNTSTSSHSQLQVGVGGSAGGNPLLRFLINGVTTGSWINGVHNSDSDKLKWSPVYNDVTFASAKMTLTTEGKLGVGDTSPYDTLSITGSINQDERVFRFTKVNFLNGGLSTIQDFEFDQAPSNSYNLEINVAGREASNSFAKKQVFAGVLSYDVLTGNINTIVVDLASATGKVNLSVAAVGSNNRLRVTITNAHATAQIGYSIEYKFITFNTAVTPSKVKVV